MVQIKDRLGELAAGIFRIKTSDDTEFELKPKIEHKRKLLFNYKQVQEAELTKALLDEQNQILQEILKNSYPEFEPAQIIDILMNYDGELLTELYMCWKWVDRDLVEKIKKKKMEEIFGEGDDKKKEEAPPEKKSTPEQETGLLGR